MIKTIVHQNAQVAYQKAYQKTVESMILPGNEQKPDSMLLSLHLFYMELNPHTLMQLDSANELLTELDKRGLRNFFTRLTARFQFYYGHDQDHAIELYSYLYLAGNIHDTLVGTGGGKYESSINLLGEENAESQFTHAQAIGFMQANRWYVLVCLFAIMYRG